MKPSFNVFTKQGHIKPHLRRAFLEQKDIDFFDVVGQEVTLKDESSWKLQLDKALVEMLRNSDTSIKCLLSCQEDWKGNRIAVARLFKDPKEKDKEES